MCIELVIRTADEKCWVYLFTETDGDHKNNVDYRFDKRTFEEPLSIESECLTRCKKSNWKQTSHTLQLHQGQSRSSSFVYQWKAYMRNLLNDWLFRNLLFTRHEALRFNLALLYMYSEAILCQTTHASIDVHYAVNLFEGTLHSKSTLGFLAGLKVYTIVTYRSQVSRL